MKRSMMIATDRMLHTSSAYMNGPPARNNSKRVFPGSASARKRRSPLRRWPVQSIEHLLLRGRD